MQGQEAMEYSSQLPFLGRYLPTEPPGPHKDLSEVSQCGHIQVQKLHYNHYIQSIQMTKFQSSTRSGA